MNREILSQPTVVFVGGLTDTRETLPLRAQPLGTDHKVIFVVGNWDDKNEPSSDKIARVRAELKAIIEEENKPISLVGISAGGPLITCAGHDLDGVDGILTAASPMRAPEKMTWVLKIVDSKFPALRGVMETFADDVLPGLSTEMKNRLMNFRGTRDGKVPPEMSVVDGAVNHQLRTPLNIIASHSYNIRNALSLDTVRQFIARPQAKLSG